MLPKTVLITGASSGIGKAAAEALCYKGFKVFLLGRNEDKLHRVCNELKAVNGTEMADYYICDLSSFKAIRKFAARFKEQNSSLDVLLNNAGAIVPKRRLTEDNCEYTFALNHLNYFLLTGLLLDVLQKSRAARIVNVSSQVHQYGHIEFEDLSGQKGYSPMKAYAQSKLANVLFTVELARRLSGTSVTVNCLHPGSVNTGFGKEMRGGFKLLMALSRPFQLSPQKGARTAVYLCSAPEVQGVSGKYFIKNREARPGKQALDPELSKKLWVLSEQLTNFHYSEVVQD